MKEDLLKLVVECVDLKKLANGILDQVIEKSIDNVVAKTPNLMDDTLKATLWPLIEKEVKELINEKLDLSKILGL